MCFLSYLSGIAIPISLPYQTNPLLLASQISHFLYERSMFLHCLKISNYNKVELFLKLFGSLGSYLHIKVKIFRRLVFSPFLFYLNYFISSSESLRPPLFSSFLFYLIHLTNPISSIFLFNCFERDRYFAIYFVIFI